ncbi:hypothetical protein ACFVUW_11205 [Streptomyces xiamenensis]|uniref:hypothetical protein n=1 Tax=Streptomyces xiamenensis TaxID=408015 RepID=UPI0036EDA443
MLDVETRAHRVHNPAVRPLVQEAVRAYNTGSPRACIMLTWTAVCSDLIEKLITLRESGEGAAAELADAVEDSRGKSDAEAIKKMQTVERKILTKACELELIDGPEQDLLERLRQDRNLCAHPSLRPVGELFEPSLEYARAHLVTALDAVLQRPPSQGRKVLEAFQAHVAAPGFQPVPNYLGITFFERVRPAVRRKLVNLAAKCAVRELAPETLGLQADALADRMAQCLKAFADRDTAIVRGELEMQMTHLEQSEPVRHINVLARLGDLSVFWDALPDSLLSLYDSSIANLLQDGQRLRGLTLPWTTVMAMVRNPDHRRRLPALEATFLKLPAGERAAVIAHSPDPYYGPHLADLMKDVGSFDFGQHVASTILLPSAGYLNAQQARDIFTEWADNSQCWGFHMPALAIRFNEALGHLGDERSPVWNTFLEALSPVQRDLVEEEADPGIEV